MKFELIFVGKTSEKFLSEGIKNYIDKLEHYIHVEITTIPVSNQAIQSKDQVAREISKRLTSRDFIVLLDEKGKQLNSVDLSLQIQHWMNQSYKKIVFITGGAFGVSDEVKKRANFICSFSQLTFTHQMIRLLLLEQLYRSMTILKGESYHHK
jgi:23S rRNA (pseudouridine1915-N3)-methyltransferase